MVLCLYVRLKDLENVENDVELVMPQDNRYFFTIYVLWMYDLLVYPRGGFRLSTNVIFTRYLKLVRSY